MKCLKPTTSWGLKTRAFTHAGKYAKLKFALKRYLLTFNVLFVCWICIFFIWIMLVLGSDQSITGRQDRVQGAPQNRCKHVRHPVNLNYMVRYDSCMWFCICWVIFFALVSRSIITSEGKEMKNTRGIRGRQLFYLLCLFMKLYVCSHFNGHSFCIGCSSFGDDQWCLV